MHGPGLTPPRSQPTPAGLITLRVVFTVLALGSCGLLSWAAPLRTAVLRKRTSDWLLFAGQLVVVITTVIVMGAFGAPPSDDPDVPTQSNGVDYVCLAILIAVSIASATHFLIADVQHFRQPPAPAYGWGTPPPAGPGHPAGPYGYPQQQPTAGPAYGYPPVREQPVHQQPPAHQQPPVHQRPPVHQQPPVPQSQPQPYQPSGQSQPQPYQPSGQPQPRINQVRAELDELSELLRKDPRDGQGGPGGQDGQGGGRRP
ncbi:hypothetical protein ACIP93_00415 [Streptomyces sp. NPDC088745]|uniref:hypothetical protein n=1 Tax=Streptomyces sp. NPDC088745 TaxID=3365884 RepID=UPI00380A4CF7